MPSFELIQFNSDGTTDRKEIDINKLNSAEDVAKEAKGFFAKNKKGKKVYTSTREKPGAKRLREKCLELPLYLSVALFLYQP